MKITSIGSGSSGNALLVQHESTAVLFDCGVGIRRVRNSLIEAGVESRLSGVVISHEHGDHVRSLGSLLRRETCTVYASRGTFSAIGTVPNSTEIDALRTITIGSLALTPVPVSHDASEPYGFLVEAAGEKAAIFTDLGIASPDVAQAVGEASTVIIESNYCDLMLADSHYPAVIKRRISSPRGHLSNDDCAGLLHTAAGERTKAIWLAHLSENNNHPELAEATILKAIGARLGHDNVRALPRFEALQLV